jgi:hypothetical protein
MASGERPEALNDARSTRRRLLAASVAGAGVAAAGLAQPSEAGSSAAIDWQDVKLGYGAKGDGVADDTNAVSSAISAVSTTGGLVYFPPGTYLLSDELVLPNAATFGPNITLCGAGRNAAVLKWPRDLGAGRCAIRTQDLDGTSIAHRVSGLQLSGPVAGGSGPRAAMDGLCLSSGGCAQDVWTQGFRAGVVVRNGLQSYRSVQSSGNDYGLLLINSVGTGDVTLDDVDLTGPAFASMVVHGDGGVLSGVNFRHVHFGFGPIGIYIEDGNHPGIDGCDFLDCGFEACGNYLLYGPSNAAAVTRCMFIENTVSSYGLNTYYQPSLGQKSPIFLPRGSWGGNTVLGCDSLTALVPGNECYLTATALYGSVWENSNGLLSAMRALGKPFARGTVTAPSGVEFGDGSARMRIRRASAAVAEDTVVRPDADEQIQPLANRAPFLAAAEGVANVGAAPGDCIPIAFEGRTDVILDADCSPGQMLMPSPSNLDRVVPADTSSAQPGPSTCLGWAIASGSAGTSVAILLRPSFLPPSVASGRAQLQLGSSGLIADTRITSTTLIRLTNTSAAGTVGALSAVPAPGTGFTINSTSTSDNSAVFWEVVQY